MDLSLQLAGRQSLFPIDYIIPGTSQQLSVLNFIAIALMKRIFVVMVVNTNNFGTGTGMRRARGFWEGIVATITT